MRDDFDSSRRGRWPEAALDSGQQQRMPGQCVFHHHQMPVAMIGQPPDEEVVTDGDIAKSSRLKDAFSIFRFMKNLDRSRSQLAAWTANVII
ncbi:hypothetical protein ACFHW2_31545 [Actinomadura sp. LOL_016]|uniref:hypothetical protein n=1 Tax=unclassified Actinomadura TaxID=2626254 RepID=UPI003A807AEC